MAADLLALRDLKDAAHRRAFDQFIPIYLAAFPEEDQREDPERWRQRLAPRAAAPSRTGLLVVGHHLDDPDRLSVAGGIVIEYYLRSCTGLVSYVAVRPDERGRGHARCLMEGARRFFHESAREAGSELRAVFAEAEDYRRFEDPHQKADAQTRLRILASLGAMWIDVPYAQPALAEVKNPVPLLLLALPEMTGHGPVMPTAAVTDFIEEYYGLFGGHEDPFLREMAGAIRSRLGTLEVEADTGARPQAGLRGRGAGEGYVVLRELPADEEPRLAFTHLGFTLHVVSVESTSELHAPTSSDIKGLGAEHEQARQRATTGLQDSETWGALAQTVPLTLTGGGTKGFCPIFNSFERDILAYRFLRRPPLVSMCADERPRAIELHFPAETTYLTEGRGVTLRAARTRIGATATVTFSRFPESGVRVWHVTLRPRSADTDPVGDGAEGTSAKGAFTEYELIKLIALYDGSQEASNVQREVRASFPGGPPLPLDFFLYALTGGTLVGATFRAGTIEADLGTDSSAVPWERLLTLADTAEPESRIAREFGQLSADAEVWSALLACSGIAQGIFDFERMTTGELAEVLRPNLRSEGPRWKSVNCGTVFDLNVEDEMLAVTERTTGLTPYLLIPHAVALHNEFVVDAAEYHVDAVRSDRGVRRLDLAAGAGERLLRRYLVPNVFQYSSERELYTRLGEHRSSDWKRESVEAKLRELEHRVEREKSFKQNRSEFYITWFLGLLSLVALIDLYDFFQDPERSAVLTAWPPTLPSVGAILTFIFFVTLFARALPRR